MSMCRSGWPFQCCYWNILTQVSQYHGCWCLSSLLNLGQNWQFLFRMTLKFDRWHWKTIGHLLCVASSFVHHFIAISKFKLELSWKTIGHLLNATSSFVHHFVAICEFKLELQSKNAQFGSKSTIFLAVWPWNLTDDLEKQWSSLLSNIMLCASFHHHMWIQTGVMVRKWISWVLTSVTLTFDVWPWPFAWTLLMSLVITPENFVMIRWWEHSKKGVRDRRTDGQTVGLNHSKSCLVPAKDYLSLSWKLILWNSYHSW